MDYLLQEGGVRFTQRKRGLRMRSVQQSGSGALHVVTTQRAVSSAVLARVRQGGAAAESNKLRSSTAGAVGWAAAGHRGRRAPICPAA